MTVDLKECACRDTIKHSYGHYRNQQSRSNNHKLKSALSLCKCAKLRPCWFVFLFSQTTAEGAADGGEQLTYLTSEV